MLTKHPIEFKFAGFNFPRYIPELRKSAYDKRTSRSVYFHAPKPENAGKGNSFYLDSDFFVGRSWEWCDETGARIDHTGWFTDEFCDTKIRGIVVSLPHGRFLAGWSMGEGMASGVEGVIYIQIKLKPPMPPTLSLSMLRRRKGTIRKNSNASRMKRKATKDQMKKKRRGTKMIEIIFLAAVTLALFRA